MLTKKDKIIKKLNEKFNRKFDYSLFPDNVSWRDKVTIICSIHGPFEQLLTNHIKNDGGCKRGTCNKRRKTIEQFIKQAREIHGNKYDYSKSIYTNTHAKLIIICPIHGEFLQGAKEHCLGGSVCPKCSSNPQIDTKDFIERASKIHSNKYDYSLVNYIGTDIKVDIMCPKHGVFKQRPHRHLQGDGCKKCSNHISHLESNWLDSLKIPDLKRQYRLEIGNKWFYVDGFDEKTNTVYEFYGTFFHGHPDFCHHYLRNTLNKQGFADLYKKTLEKEKIIKEAGYNLIVIWEHEWCEKMNIKLRRNRITTEEDYQIRLQLMRMWEYADGIRYLDILHPGINVSLDFCN